MALSTLARIRPRERHAVYPPAVLVPLARRLFEGFFDVAESGPADIVMSHLGLRHLVPGMLQGKRYYSPFYWTSRAARTRITLKDKVNDLGFQVAFATTRLSRPERQYLHEYQGFMEMQGLRPFRDVTLEEYLSEAQKDFDGIHSHVLEMFGQGGLGIGRWSFLRDQLIRSCRPNLRQRFFPLPILRSTKGTILQKNSRRSG